MDHRRARMSSLIALFLIVVLCGNAVHCNTISTRKPEKIEVSSKNDNKLFQKDTPWSSILLNRLESINAVDLNKIENNQTNKSDIEKTFDKRKSRFLGSLAFLAGLSVGGLTSAASSTVKAYSKFPQGAIAMNFVPPKVGPYLAAYYDPFSFVQHPYIYQTPLGLYPLLDPFKLQSLIAGTSQQSGGDRPTEILTLLDNKRPSGSDDNDEEEYIIEQTKLEKKKPSSRLENRSDETTDSQTEENEKTEVEIVSKAVPCDRSKKLEEQEDSPTIDPLAYDLEDLQEDADDSRAQMKVERNSTTVRPTRKPSTKSTVRPTTRPQTSAPTTKPSESNTTYPQFYGYYGGSPQDISHIDLTSGTQSPFYHVPNPINYNLPYDRPADFYPDDKYNYYSNAHPNPYPSGPYFTEQLADYSRNDFDPFLYSSDNNAPSYVNEFKPVT